MYFKRVKKSFYYYWKSLNHTLVVNRFRLSYIWKFIFIFKIQTNISNTWLDITFIYFLIEWRKENENLLSMGFGPEIERKIFITKRECPVLLCIWKTYILILNSTELNINVEKIRVGFSFLNLYKYICYKKLTWH